MSNFDPESYGPAIAPLLSESRLPTLGPGTPNAPVQKALAAITPEIAFPSFRDRSMAMACISALWLLHDFLHESHEISQDIDTPTGSYWHGIMHRREPDPDNAKYWFRRIGAHPVVEMLGSEAPQLGYPYQNPLVFVDFCERVRGSASDDEMLARRVQLLEWQLLFDWCYRKAISG